MKYELTFLELQTIGFALTWWRDNDLRFDFDEQSEKEVNKLLSQIFQTLKKVK